MQLLKEEQRQSDPETGLLYWTKASDTRYPWARKETGDALRAWIREAENADKLTAAGERVCPLLLSGETRCGKTSTMCSLALEYFGIPSYRVNLCHIIGGHMGETMKSVQGALMEAANGPTALWIMDEVDGLFPQRHRDTQACTVEMNAALSVALTIIESLPQHLMLVGTTNEPEIIDRAMLARFTHVRFPRWAELTDAEKRSFAKSHQLDTAWDVLTAGSYAEVVQRARTERVKKILGGPNE